MDSAKKYAAYAVIIVALLGIGLFSHAVRKLDEEGGRHADTSAARTGGAFVKPAGGGEMNAAELAWMLREKLTLDVMEQMVTGGPELDAYNKRAREYNELGLAIAYKESDLASARALAEGMKGDIVRAAIADTLAAAMPVKALNDPKAAAVWKIQKFLSLMGYYPGAVNGEENEGTVSAVKMFELKSNSPVTGIADENIAASIEESWITRVTPAVITLGNTP